MQLRLYGDRPRTASLSFIIKIYILYKSLNEHGHSCPISVEFTSEIGPEHGKISIVGSWRVLREIWLWCCRDQRVRLAGFL